MPEKTSVYLPDTVLSELASRGDNRSGLVARDLTRLYTLYKRALAGIRLTVEEACLIVDALNGAILNADTARLLYAEIEDAVQLDHLDKKWGVDGPALVQKLKGLTDTQALALIDAAERFWNNPDVSKRDVREAVKEYFNIAG